MDSWKKLDGIWIVLPFTAFSADQPEFRSVTMTASLLGLDVFEDQYSVDQRAEQERSKPARCYSPRFDRRRRRDDGTHNGAHRRGQKRKGL
jgi:hypothetical protein